MRNEADGRSAGRRPGWWAFIAWAFVGCAIVVAILTPLTIGVAMAAIAVAGSAALLAWPAARNVSASGLVSGAGPLLLYVSYLNRNGPGEVCTSSRVAIHCETEWSPWPWLALGLVAIGAGLGIFIANRRAR